MSAVASTRPTRSREAAVVATLWKRELLRWGRDRMRMLASAAVPLVFLLMLGSGLRETVGTLLPGAAVPVGFDVFVFPGIVAMAVFLTATYSAISLVYDREFGILKGVLVAPVSRGTVVWGKTLGGATVATLQGTLVLAFAPLAGVRVDVWLLVRIWPVMFIGALAVASLGVALGARSRSVETYQVVNQLVALPLIFLSGIFFPSRGLPGWMEVAVRANPLSYAVDALRRFTLAAQGLSTDVIERLGTSGLALTLGDRQLTTTEEIVIVAAFAVATQYIAVRLIR